MPHVLPPAVEAITSNPLRTRSDMVHILHSLLVPVHGAMSTGGARVRLGHTGTHFDAVAAEMEGFARALWGLAPLLSSDPDNAEIKGMRDDWVRGLVAGTKIGGDEYWGDCIDKDQRFVEMAAIGFSLAIAPKVFWEPLKHEEKVAVNKWLLQCNSHLLPDNNWRFFRILVNLGLKSVGAEYSQKAIDDELDFIETFYGPHGFPSDGNNTTCKAYDYYATSFAIPFYTLLYARLAGISDPVRAKRFRERGIANLPNVVQLFAPDGGVIPFGRSMTYRFACSAFFAAVAFDGLELPKPFTWGVIKGLLLRNIRWFTQKPSVFNRDGSLSIGYAYPNLFMSEDYNSAQSPYWALKSFLVLALPETHPFWQAEEESFPAELLSRPFTIVEPWMQVFTHAAGHTFCLSSGQEVAFPMRHAAAKYGKLAYSASFGFSVPTGALGLQQHAPDSELALSDDSEGERWVVRRRVEDVSISDNGVIKSTWRPWPDVTVTTWSIPPPCTSAAYHTRVHHIVSPRRILASDAGFAIHSHTGPSADHERRIPTLASPVSGDHGRYESPHSALAVSKAGVSGVIDLLGAGRGVVQDADGNSNLMSPRTVIPLLLHEVKREMWLASTVFAVPADERGRWGTG
ncbi:hypothetical protein EHS25_006792 [Saitozyma podzolica]|uniref:DUF2264 domain-containing protein n=1 Tax=Saitozyma podzolica TaxID=1890683 RepID=A0A427XRF6_9TREE|nr:hypothetical protein EHS25_006792 [Saitozyma podzolica]